MRIIAGRFRRRKLLPPPTGVRPTLGRVRESIFHLIHSLGVPMEGAYVLDAFAGSGALGLEALSQGAAHVTFLENNIQVVKTLKENIASLGVTSQCSLIVGDAAKPPRATHPVTLAFLDPPYDQVVEGICLTALRNQVWIQPQTLVILETPAKRALSLSPEALLIKQRRYGAALVSLLNLPDEA